MGNRPVHTTFLHQNKGVNSACFALFPRNKLTKWIAIISKKELMWQNFRIHGCQMFCVFNIYLTYNHKKVSQKFLLDIDKLILTIAFLYLCLGINAYLIFIGFTESAKACKFCWQRFCIFSSMRDFSVRMVQCTTSIILEPELDSIMSFSVG